VRAEGGSEAEDGWLDWSETILEEGSVAWLRASRATAAEAALELGLPVLAEWHYRLQRGNRERSWTGFQKLLKRYVDGLNASRVLEAGRRLFDEFHRQVLALPRAPRLTFSEGPDRSLAQFTRAERIRLMTPLAERRDALRDFLLKLRLAVQSSRQTPARQK